MSWLESALQNAVKGAITDETKALDALIDRGKAALRETGKDLLASAKDELDSLTVTITIRVAKK